MTKSKIIIPQQVADAIEKMKEVYTNFGVVQTMETRGMIPVGMVKAVETLRIWTHDEEGDGRNADRLLDALVNGYEIEPELEVGDWILWENEHTSIILEIKELNKYGFHKDRYLINDEYGSGGYVRHLAPEEIVAEKERLAWAEIGREVGEIRQGDIGEGNTGRLIFTQREIESAFSRGTLKGLFPIERFVDFWGDDHE